MTITAHTVGNVLVLEVTAARIDAVNALAVQSALIQAVTPGAGRVVLDLASVHYLSSAGIRSFLRVANHVATAAAGPLVLCGLQATVHEILEVAGLLGRFPAFATRSEALAKLSAAL